MGDNSGGPGRFRVVDGIAKERTEEINLSVNTISTYRSRILTKFGMKTNAELTV